MVSYLDIDVLLDLINTLPIELYGNISDLWCDFNRHLCSFSVKIDLQERDVIKERVKEHIKKAKHNGFNFVFNVDLEVK